MRRIRKILAFIFFLYVFYPLVSWASCPGTPADCYVKTGSGPYTYAATGCSYDEVNQSVQAADDGDTVTVPACSETTWESQLVIQKAIIFKGAGAGVTNIKSTYNADVGAVLYSPTTPSADHRFRVSGFTLTTGVNSILYLMHPSATAEYVRIDNNVFTETGAYKTIYVKGTIFGSIDNNVFSGGGAFFAFEGYGTGSVQWAGVTREYGSQYNLYIEDNTFSGSGHFSTGGQGGRHVSRYNTYSGTFKYLYDYHGNQPGGISCTGNSTCGNASTMITEIYGNHWTKTNGYTNLVSDHRGGWANVFMNLLDTSTSASTNSMKIREEYSDDLWPVGSYVQHPTNSYYWANWNVKSTGTVLMSPYIDDIENGCAGPATDWLPNNLYGGASASSDIYNQRFTNDANKYCWKKTTYGGGMVEPYLTGSTEPDWSSVAPRYIIADGNIHWINMGAASPIYENIDIFTQRSDGTFDGSGSASHGGGVGCGTLANRPETCTTGVGYWATNQKCDDLTGMVGAHPTTPISGTLWKCNDDEEWEPYYTPYTYPHPLRRLGNQLSGGVVAGGTF